LKPAPTNAKNLLITPFFAKKTAFYQKMPQKPTTLRKKITHPANFTFGGHGSPYGLSCGHLNFPNNAVFFAKILTARKFFAILSPVCTKNTANWRMSLA
jgi:hypothetical protein